VRAGSRARRRGRPIRRALAVAALVLATAVVATALAPSAASAAPTPGTREICPTGAVTPGVNVSDDQGTIDWPAVKAAGYHFGYALAIDGIGNLDDNFVANYQGMRAAGVKPGGYLYFRAWADAETQAHRFIELLQQAGYAPGDLLPVIDVEKDVQSTSPYVPPATVVAKLHVVEDIVEAAIGIRPMIYTGPNHWAVELANPTDFAANPLWIANYDNDCPEVPNPWATWTFWQYADKEDVPGIPPDEANVNLFNGPLGSLPSAPAAAPAFYAADPPRPASVGAPYTYRFRATGVPAPTYAVEAGGSLPPGIALDPATGALTGQPTTPGTYQFMVRATNGVGPGALSSSIPLTIQVAPPGAGFHSLVPYRVLDSRTPTGGWNAKLVAGPNSDRPVTVTGASGVPATASAVVMNVTAVESTAASYLTVYPGDVPRPVTSNLNFGKGQIIPNLVTVRVGAGGIVRFSTNTGATDVVADIVGYYDDGTGPGERFNGVAPTRILDSRTSTGGWPGKIGDGETRTLQVTGGARPVPAGATSVVMNVTVTEGTALSFLELWPAGPGRPGTSNLNAAPGQTIPNLVTVKLSPGGAVSIFNSDGATHVIADVVGYYGASGSRFYPLPAPRRIVDSRIAVGLAGRIWSARPAPSVDVTGRNGIPVGATGLVANVTVTDSTSESFLSVVPGNQPIPPRPTSNLNFGRDQVIPNLVVVGMPAAGAGTGQIRIFNADGLVYAIVDAVGYFAP
jgi:GH25 family lysozyme M1 (1,4-beta-N-acetylmuramidase)